MVVRSPLLVKNTNWSGMKELVRRLDGSGIRASFTTEVHNATLSRAKDETFQRKYLIDVE